MGICLGTSPVYNNNVALLLRRKTALVSPQFHIKFDNTFQTVKDINKESYWQTKSGFVSRVNKTIPLSSNKAKSSKKQEVTSASEGGILLGSEVLPAEEYTLLPGKITPASVGGAKMHANKRTSSTYVSEGDKVPQSKSSLAKHKQTRYHHLTESGGQ